MFLKLRIFFTILSALCAAAVLPVGAFFDLIWAIPIAVCAVVFYLLMLLCKQEQEKREPPKQEPVPAPESLGDEPSSPSTENEDGADNS